MNKRDPKLIVLLFNECINNKDIERLSSLMTEDHIFIDREGNTLSPKVKMIEAWKSFFKSFPDYKNTFLKIESEKNKVLITGFAFWSKENPYDPAIWTAIVENDMIKEWHIFYDTEENRKKFRRARIFLLDQYFK